MSSNRNRYATVLLASLALPLSPVPATAAENGLTRALTGAQGYELTLPLYPGLYVDVWGQDYRATTLRDNDGHAAARQVAVPGLGSVPVAIRDRTTVDLLIPRLTWLTGQTIADGRLGFGVSLPVARVDNRLDFSSPVPALAGTLQQQGAAASGRRTGQGDVEAAGFVDWQSDLGRVSAGLSLGIPTGDYDRSRPVNPGFGNYWTLRPIVIASHLFASGLQVGSFTSYAFNTRNRDTRYRSGDFFQSDVMALWPVGDSWRLGAQGFVLGQTTDDRDGAVRVAGNRARALGLGPTVAYVSDSDWGVDMKVLKEFAVRNRTQGVVTWLRLHMRID